ncbi:MULTISPECIES: AfsR/SARP family transcriptional regulator [Actinoalloteichus]|uniref:DNA-binding transcriptional activator of the SARP family n=1 Tax=Actinoalloteichus fjordicus TaxID=1612552 RepID=A0AAC9PSJ7_9PSEU|nr:MULTISPECIES: BTAD domain-containing putative transcriptional regulator [Actinoalloteichus]APU15619.1 DNA-binding transcriptional activator of the SARP family [Actinoalloteichus fjordicus]APU21679.1 DNA-binding transcriptional activator of the SARP family [Actinoalloteichus sp. GBA129-24]
MSELLFGVLGPVVACRGSVAVRLPSGKRRLVLAVLLLHADDRVDREQIIDVVWGDRPPPSAVNLVQKYVGEVRRALGLDSRTLESVGHGYLLRVSPEQLDSGRFVRLLAEAVQRRVVGDQAGARLGLGEASALWRGPAFSGIETADAVTERARLDEYRVRAWEELAELDLSRGENVPAIAELSRLAAEHPFRERVRELHMIALYRGGRHAEALAVFQDVRRLLAEELGADPGPRLRMVHEQILRADPALDSAGELPQPVLSPVCQLPSDIPTSPAASPSSTACSRP